MKFTLWVLGYVVGTVLAVWLLDGLELSGPSGGRAELLHKAGPILTIALIFSIITLVAVAVLRAMSLPLLVLTLGALLLGVNAALLMIAGWISAAFGLGFTVGGPLTALGGSAVITALNCLVDVLIEKEDPS